MCAQIYSTLYIGIGIKKKVRKSQQKKEQTEKNSGYKLMKVLTFFSLDENRSKRNWNESYNL